MITALDIIAYSAAVVIAVLAICIIVLLVNNTARVIRNSWKDKK